MPLASNLAPKDNARIARIMRFMTVTPFWRLSVAGIGIAVADVAEDSCGFLLLVGV